ncbi:MAG: hypothetical protein K2Q17_03280 [Nitrospiraceae bacterium]|nr:hypothetical protein [Nitrospiraceae bacterium]
MTTVFSIVAQPNGKAWHRLSTEDVLVRRLRSDRTVRGGERAASDMIMPEPQVLRR